MVVIHLSTIQHYSTKDGPGIRSAVFLIGCNLRRAWYSNPELMLSCNKLLHFSSLYRGYQSCVYAYPAAVYMEDGAIHMHPCAQHMARELEEICPFDALEQVGIQVGCQRLVKQLKKDFTYYEESRGGVTFSGKEPLLRTEALAGTLYLLKQKHIAACMDTAGNMAQEHMERAAQYCDLFSYDIKAFGAALHKKITGANNDRILDNARRLVAMYKPMWIRMIIVKRYNDDRRDLWKRL